MHVLSLSVCTDGVQYNNKGTFVSPKARMLQVARVVSETEFSTVDRTVLTRDCNITERLFQKVCAAPLPHVRRAPRYTLSSLTHYRRAPANGTCHCLRPGRR